MAIWVSQFNMPIRLELMKFSLPDDVWLLPLSKHFMGSSESPYGVVTTTVRPSVLIYRHRSISWLSIISQSSLVPCWALESTFQVRQPPAPIMFPCRMPMFIGDPIYREEQTCHPICCILGDCVHPLCKMVGKVNGVICQEKHVSSLNPKGNAALFLLLPPLIFPWSKPLIRLCGPPTPQL